MNSFIVERSHSPLGSKRRHAGSTEERNRLCEGRLARFVANEAGRRDADSDDRRLSRTLGRGLRRAAGARRPKRILHLPRARRESEPLRPLGAGAGIRQGRRGLPDDAQSPGISGDLDGLGARRRGVGADQHQSDRPLARPLRRHRRRQGGDRRGLSAAAVRRRARASRRRPRRFRPWRRRGRRTARRRRGRDLQRGSACRARASRADDRRQRALHLHLGHDRIAQGRAHHPFARAAHHVRFCRCGERQAPGPHL